MATEKQIKSAAGYVQVEGVAVDWSSVFWSNVHPEGLSGCWLWHGAVTSEGYGQHGRSQKAHRTAWTLTNGQIQNGAWVLHRCDVRLCVNPDHLFLGSAADNNADMKAKGRVGHGASHGTRTCPDSVLRGHLHPGAGLSAEEVADVRARLVAGEGVKSIARQHGVGHATVSRIKSGLSYRSLGADHVGRPGAKVR